MYATLSKGKNWIVIEIITNIYHRSTHYTIIHKICITKIHTSTITNLPPIWYLLHTSTITNLPHIWYLLYHMNYTHYTLHPARKSYTIHHTHPHLSQTPSLCTTETYTAQTCTSHHTTCINYIHASPYTHHPAHPHALYMLYLLGEEIRFILRVF